MAFDDLYTHIILYASIVHIYIYIHYNIYWYILYIQGCVYLWYRWLVYVPYILTTFRYLLLFTVMAGADHPFTPQSRLPGFGPGWKALKVRWKRYQCEATCGFWLKLLIHLTKCVFLTQTSFCNSFSVLFSQGAMERGKRTSAYLICFAASKSYKPLFLKEWNNAQQDTSSVLPKSWSVQWRRKPLCYQRFGGRCQEHHV